MSDWNTSGSNKTFFEGILRDPVKLSLAVVGLGVLLVTGWALSFREKPADNDSATVAFSIPDASKSLPPPASGFSLAKRPQKKSADPEADALNTLQAEAVKEAADAPGETPSEEPYEAEDEAGAPGKPIAEEAAWRGGANEARAAAGSLGDFKGFGSGGSSAGGIGAGAGAAQAAAAGQGALGSEGAARTLQGAAGAGRAVSGGGRAMRSSAEGSVSGAAGGIGHGAGGRFAPGGASGSTFGTTGGAGVGTPGGGAGAGYPGGGGAGLAAQGGGGVGDQPKGGGGGPETGGGGGGNPPGGDGGGGPGPLAPVAAKKRGEVKKDAQGVLNTAKSYKTTVLQKIMAEERADLQALSLRSLQAHTLLKTGETLLETSAPKFAAFPKVAQNLTETRVGMEQQFPKFKEGGDTLKTALKTLTKVPAQCSVKKEAVTRGDDGLADDSAGVLRAHRSAITALRRIAVARVAVTEMARLFKEDAAADEPVLRAADPKLADAYHKLSVKIQKDLDQAAKLIPASLYPTKGKGKAAKNALSKKLKPIRKASDKGAKEVVRRHAEITAAHRAYPQTQDLRAAEDAVLNAKEASNLVNVDNVEAGGPLLIQAEVFLPPLVKAGEYASEAYLELCDTYSGLTRLAKDAPAK